MQLGMLQEAGLTRSYQGEILVEICSSKTKPTQRRMLS